MENLACTKIDLYITTIERAKTVEAVERNKYYAIGATEMAALTGIMTPELAQTYYDLITAKSNAAIYKIINY